MNGLQFRRLAKLVDTIDERLSKIEEAMFGISLTQPPKPKPREVLSLKQTPKKVNAQ